jgi:hypothetical protein
VEGDPDGAEKFTCRDCEKISQPPAPFHATPRGWAGPNLLLLARGAARQARLWTYVRDDRPFAGGAPPAALFHFSVNREKTHPNRHLAEWHGTLQADAYGGYNDLYRVDRCPAPIKSALCWSHARRKFFELKLERN